MGGAANGRTPRRKRTHVRPLGRKASLLPLVKRLTARDLKILEYLLENRVLTIHQLQHLFFSSASVARRRMLILYRLGLVDRFDPPLVRSGPSHYVLDHLGARIVAAQRGVEFREMGWHKEDVETFPWWRELRHLLETNEFMVRLIAACRAHDGHQVTEWWGELHCQRAWAEMAFPDSYAQLQGPDGTVGFFLELDRGTESPSRLESKLARYEEASQLDNRPDVLLFCFPDPEREVAARKRLYSPGMPVATAVFDVVTQDPLGAVWLPVGSQRRVPLLSFGAPSLADTAAEVGA